MRRWHGIGGFARASGIILAAGTLGGGLALVAPLAGTAGAATPNAVSGTLTPNASQPAPSWETDKAVDGNYFSAIKGVPFCFDIGVTTSTAGGATSGSPASLPLTSLTAGTTPSGVANYSIQNVDLATGTAQLCGTNNNAAAGTPVTMAPVATNTGGSATDSIPLWSQGECNWTTTSGTINVFDSNQDLEQAGSQSAFGQPITNGVTGGTSETYPTCTGGVGVSASGGLGDAWTVNTANPLPTPIDTNASAAEGDLASSNLDLTSASSGSVGGCWGSVNILSSTSTTSFGSSSTVDMTLPSAWANGGNCKYGSLGNNEAGGNTDTAANGPTGDANCPPSQADVNAGLMSCGMIVSSGNDENGSTNYSSLDLFYNGQPVPQQPTATLSSGTVQSGSTVSVTGGTNWFGSAGGAPNAGPYGDFQNSAYEFYPVTAPNIYIGTSRATAVPVVDSTVTISGDTYVCTGAESATVGPNPCTLTAGVPSGTFQVPSGLALGAYNIYIDESNTTPLPGNGPNDSYQTARGKSLGTAESSTPINVKASSTDTDSPTTSSIVLGNSDTDSATITGSSTGDPTGTVTFYECGPVSTPAPCTSSSWTSIGSKSLGGTTNPDTLASSSFKPSSAGYWCFTSTYAGDSNYLSSSDSGDGGCFHVTATSSTDVNSTSTSTIALGGSNTDLAKVTGSSTPDPTGAVTFYECGPDSSPSPCTSSTWTEYDTESLSGTANPSTVTSASFKPSAAGYWCFASAYAGDSNYLSSSDTTTDGCFDVAKPLATSSVTNSPASTSIVLGSTDTDQAKITGNSTPDPTGSVTFYECGPVSGPAPCTSATWNQYDSESLKVASNPTTVSSATFKPSSPGYWCFASAYSGDSNYLSSSDTTSDGCFDVTKAPSTNTNSPTASSILIGSSNTDTAKVTGTGAPDPTGSVTFYECGPVSSPAPCTSSSWMQYDMESLSGSANPSNVASASFQPDSVGFWCFTSVYSGDGNYLSSWDATSDGCFDVTARPSSITNSATSASVTLGASDTDSATVTGSSTPDPTGSVTFYECGPVSSPAPCSSGSWTEVGTAQSLPGNANPGTVSSSSFKPTAAGYWCFTSTYAGDSNYLSSSDTTSDGCFDVKVPAPTITSFTPASGAAGATVTIKGTNLTGVTKVMIGSVAATIVAGSDKATQIKIKNPGKGENGQDQGHHCRRDGDQQHEP